MLYFVNLATETKPRKPTTSLRSVPDAEDGMRQKESPIVTCNGYDKITMKSAPIVFGVFSELLQLPAL